MRKKRTGKWHETTLRLVSGGRETNTIAYSHYGQLNQGLTTSQRTKEGQALTELLNELERQATILLYKSSQVYDILTTDISPRVRRLDITTNLDGIKKADNITDD